MTMESESKLYELAYLLSPGIAEGDVLARAEEFSRMIEGVKGLVQYSDTPKKRDLAYQIKKEKSAYFGWIKFLLVPGSVHELVAAVKMKEDVLRFFIVESEPIAVASAPRTQHVTERSRKAAVAPAAAVPTPSDGEPAEEKLDLEALDKKLEEILGK